MRFASKSSIVVATVGSLTAMAVRPATAQPRAQADVQIQAFDVRPARTTKTLSTRQSAGISITLTVFSNNDDDANGAKVQVFLPPETAILTVPRGCTAVGAGTGLVGPYHAFLSCDLGSIFVNGSRTIQFTVTEAPSYIAKRYGAFAYSETPDPFTGNNYAERTLP